MLFIKRPGTDVVCYTKPLDSLKGWNDHFFWVDTFACPALFPWYTGKSVSRDGVPESSEFNVEHYATLTVDPTKVRVGERERDEASVDKLFDEGWSGEQVDPGYSVGGGHGVGVQLADAKVVDAGEPSHPAKKLRSDYGAPGVPDVGGKSQSTVHHLLAGAVQHVEVRGGAMPTLPFVSSFVSTTPERKGGDYIVLLAGANLRTLDAPQRFIISSYSSDPSGVNIAEAEVDYVVRTFVPIKTNATTATPTAGPAAIAKEKLVSGSEFGGDSSFAGESHPISGSFSDRTGGDFLVGGIRTVVDPDSNLQRVYVPYWNVTDGFCMDDGGVCHEMVDEFPPSKFFASIRGMEHDQLFTEFNVGAARQISLGADVRKRAEYNIKEIRRLKSVVEEKDSLLKSRCDEIESLKAQLLIKEAEAAKAVHLRLAASIKVREQEVTDLNVVVSSVKLQNDSLADQLEVASSGFQEKLSHYENLTDRLEEFQGAQLKLLTHGMKLAITTCLHSSEYQSALGAAIGKAIEKGMQDGLASGITHGVEGMTLADVAAYNPSAEADYFSALQQDNLAERLGLTESQPCVDQLMVPIHLSPDRVVVGAISLSFDLDFSDARVRKTRENIASQRPTLRDVFTPISEPFSVEVLTGTGGTFDTVSSPITTALSVTSIVASTILPISTDDYEITHTGGGEDV
uniref:Transposase (Putative), gypsy type n=1 Tax=Tanacetum cinerariifolium TaxID=118510 RepID=A0A699IYR0_TANCI|nr:hypothetical protein [Tanacetum cinerariifolium]